MNVNESLKEKGFIARNVFLICGVLVLFSGMSLLYYGEYQSALEAAHFEHMFSIANILSDCSSDSIYRAIGDSESAVVFAPNCPVKSDSAFLSGSIYDVEGPSMIFLQCEKHSKSESPMIDTCGVAVGPDTRIGDMYVDESSVHDLIELLPTEAAQVRVKYNHGILPFGLALSATWPSIVENPSGDMTTLTYRLKEIGTKLKIRIFSLSPDTKSVSVLGLIKHTDVDENRKKNKHSPLRTGFAPLMPSTSSSSESASPVSYVPYKRLERQMPQTSSLPFFSPEDSERQQNMGRHNKRARHKKQHQKERGDSLSDDDFDHDGDDGVFHEGNNVYELKQMHSKQSPSTSNDNSFRKAENPLLSEKARQHQRSETKEKGPPSPVAIAVKINKLLDLITPLDVFFPKRISNTSPYTSPYSGNEEEEEDEIFYLNANAEQQLKDSQMIAGVQKKYISDDVGDLRDEDDEDVSASSKRRRRRLSRVSKRFSNYSAKASSKGKTLFSDPSDESEEDKFYEDHNIDDQAKSHVLSLLSSASSPAPPTDVNEQMNTNTNQEKSSSAFPEVDQTPQPQSSNPKSEAIVPQEPSKTQDQSSSQHSVVNTHSQTSKDGSVGKSITETISLFPWVDQTDASAQSFLYAQPGDLSAEELRQAVIELKVVPRSNIRCAALCAILFGSFCVILGVVRSLHPEALSEGYEGRFGGNPCTWIFWTCSLTSIAALLLVGSVAWYTVFPNLCCLLVLLGSFMAFTAALLVFGGLINRSGATKFGIAIERFDDRLLLGKKVAMNEEEERAVKEARNFITTSLLEHAYLKNGVGKIEGRGRVSAMASMLRSSKHLLSEEFDLDEDGKLMKKKKEEREEDGEEERGERIFLLANGGERRRIDQEAEIQSVVESVFVNDDHGGTDFKKNGLH
eukprot:GDKJ01013397.1.p1 GENE.GDKJ01013397.1~~GDKJ01013397.1.p1  ORF type:complete len:908 (-),score=184.39 GDKJ01013397.1:81-2804(-)